MSNDAVLKIKEYVDQDNPLVSLPTNIAHSLMISGLFSDLTIVCGDRKFHVHRSIL